MSILNRIDNSRKRKLLIWGVVDFPYQFLPIASTSYQFELNHHHHRWYGTVRGRHWLCEFGSRHRLHVSDLLWQGTPKQPGPLRHNIPKNRLRGSTAKVISQSHSLLICHRCCYSRLRIDFLSHIFSILKLKLWNFHRLMFSLLQHQPQQATTCIDVLMIDSCDKGICFWCSSKRGM